MFSNQKWVARTSQRIFYFFIFRTEAPTTRTTEPMSEVFEIKSKPKSKHKTERREENNVGSVARLFSSYSGSAVCVLHTTSKLILVHMVYEKTKLYTPLRALALATCWSKFSSILNWIRFMCIDMPQLHREWQCVWAHLLAHSLCLSASLLPSLFRSLVLPNSHPLERVARVVDEQQHYGFGLFANSHGSLIVYLSPLKFCFSLIRFELHTQSKRATYKIYMYTHSVHTINKHKRSERERQNEMRQEVEEEEAKRHGEY